MNKLSVSAMLIMFSMVVSADENTFLTVDALTESGFTPMSGQQILTVMANRKIKVVDIETGAMSVSKKNKSSVSIDRKFVETKSDNASTMFDPGLMARAPALEGKVERKVVGDELISTDGVRTYHYRLYKKQERIFAVRDIDHGNVFFEVKLQ